MKASNNDLRVLDQAPAKAVIGSLSKRKIQGTVWCGEKLCTKKKNNTKPLQRVKRVRRRSHRTGET